MAADNAASLIADVARKVQAAKMWEAEGVLTTENTDGASGSMPEIPFRVSVQNAVGGPVLARARLEVTGGVNPLVRVCDGHIQESYLVVSKRYWKTADETIDVCAYPFTEWAKLDSELHSPVVIGKENLKMEERTIKCTVVRGAFADQNSALAGSRTLWIDEISKMVWMYRIGGASDEPGRPGGHTVQSYKFLWQAQAGIRRSDDLWMLEPDEGATEILPSSATSEATNPPSPVPLPLALPKNLYRIGGKVSPPALIHKTEPTYTKAAQHAKIEGRVILSAEVHPDGKAHNFQIVQNLDPGLDQKAIEAVTQWRFRPGMRDGNPVAVLATFEINFRLR